MSQGTERKAVPLNSHLAKECGTITKLSFLNPVNSSKIGLIWVFRRLPMPFMYMLFFLFFVLFSLFLYFCSNWQQKYQCLCFPFKRWQRLHHTNEAGASFFKILFPAPSTSCSHLDWLLFATCVSSWDFIYSPLGWVSIFLWISLTPYAFLLDFFFIWMKSMLIVFVVLQKNILCRNVGVLNVCCLGVWLKCISLRGWEPCDSD